ncbi:DSBA-like thioredoxin domain protein [Candidatus Fokinia solitaria]|uniref:DSBA-like thioredoxin domain protein n=1 Tax=Candidatus Fokinia solitaria TaxID=1802984 RepID=A0A2U8BR49_9RICK|nr:DsbA family protein [Candidatus Fokinia solitaria]AWD32827.1 DSBA-like thioredoxin domain protein [Candidatus Fokinia solitaria]
MNQKTLFVAILVTIVLVIAVATYVEFIRKREKSAMYKKQSVAQLESLIDERISNYIQKNPEKLAVIVEEYYNKKRFDDEVEEIFQGVQNDPSVSILPTGQQNLDEVQMVIFFDYLSEASRAFLSIQKEFAQQTKVPVRIFYKGIPGTEDSVVLTKIAIASYIISPSGYQALHEAFLTAPIADLRDYDKIMSIVQNAGINIEKLNALLIDSEATSSIETILANNVDSAQHIGVRVTPSFLVKNKLFDGTQSVDNLNNIVGNVLQDEEKEIAELAEDKEDMEVVKVEEEKHP